MSEIGVFTPEQARLLWQDYQSRQQLAPHLAQNFPRRRIEDEPSPHRVFIRNDADETMPAYGCGQVTGTDDEGDITVVRVEKPSGTDGTYLINSEHPIAAGKLGWAYRYGVVIFRGTAAADVAQFRPIASSWNIEEGEGPFTVYGSHSVIADGLIGRIGAAGGGGGIIEYKITSLTTKASGPYTGLKAAEAVIHGAPCGRSELIGTTVEVIDHSNELFDEASMVGFTGWASEMVFLSLDDEADCDTLTPCHWAAINRVCTADTGDYAEPCPPPE